MVFLEALEKVPHSSETTRDCADIAPASLDIRSVGSLQKGGLEKLLVARVACHLLCPERFLGNAPVVHKNQSSKDKKRDARYCVAGAAFKATRRNALLHRNAGDPIRLVRGFKTSKCRSGLKFRQSQNQPKKERRAGRSPSAAALKSSRPDYLPSTFKSVVQAPRAIGHGDPAFAWLDFVFRLAFATEMMAPRAPCAGRRSRTAAMNPAIGFLRPSWPGLEPLGGFFFGDRRFRRS